MFNILRSRLRLRTRLRALGYNHRLSRLSNGDSISSPWERFRDVDDGFWRWLNLEASENPTRLTGLVPGFPTDAVQKRFSGTSSRTNIEEAFDAYQLFREMNQKYGRTKRNDGLTILDFGCGWGRILRFFLRDSHGDNLYGVDCLTEAIRLSKELNPYCRFELSDPMPPSKFPSEHFDLVYLFSVFSHLSEEAHLLWLEEFRRLLKKGGVLIATTFPRSFILRCQACRDGKEEGYPGMLQAFNPAHQWLERYDRGEFCFEPTGGGQELASSFYGEACVSEAYVRSHWENYFEVCEYLLGGRGRVAQNVIVARR